MSTGTLIFSHANSYPAGCYRLLFETWRQAGWRVEAIERLGHDPRYPVSSNWPHLVDELAAFVASVQPQPGPLVLVGHSLGGLLSLMLAARQPDLAQAVVQLDSPFISGWRRQLLRAAKHSGLAWKVPPASVARRRRDHWPDAAAVARHFASKAPFQRWDPAVLADYLRCGFEPDAERGGLRLAFRHEIEMRIYAGLPHNLPQAARALRTPIGFIAGRQSAEMRQGGLAATRRFIGAERFVELDGSHLFPFEQAQRSANEVLRLLQRLLG